MKKILLTLLTFSAIIFTADFAHARLNCAGGESKMARSSLLTSGSCSSGFALSPYEGNVKCISANSPGLAKVRRDFSDPPSYGYNVAFCFTMTGSEVVLGDLNRATHCSSRVGYMCPGNRMARLVPVFPGSESCTIDCD